ncbi:MAG TPA: alkaline phosphatase family protein [Longimicrobiales bacterium]|nr:alkaline phosphatase family protein [Longimicrobiales bacterium]
MRGVLFLFLDGVGIGTADAEHNPFLSARLPVLAGVLGGSIPTLDAPALSHHGGREAASVPLDAQLGVEGVPQSGTGQTALLTGHNAARAFGGHFGPWVPVKLRPLVEEESVLRRSVLAGHATAFANAYPQGWPGPRGSRRVAGPPLAARGAGLLTRDHRHLERGEAVASEMVNDGWRRHLGFAGLPTVGPREAGATLGRLARGHRLTLYAHYSTDTAGHRGGMAGAREALERVDLFLGGVLETLPQGHLLVVASDHGNVEDVRTGHTRNPALGLVVGPEAEARSRELSSLVDVTPRVLAWLGEG